MPRIPASSVRSTIGVVAEADAQTNKMTDEAASAFTAVDTHGLGTRRQRNGAFDRLVKILAGSGLLMEDLDYHIVRASMVIIFLFFGYQKWFEYEAQVLIPFIGNGPLIFWMYPVFGIRGASWFLGVSEWSFGVLLFLGFWNKHLGILGAAGSTATFIMTVTIIPFMPNGWAEFAGGFPAMVGNVAFLMKDVALLAASIYLLKQDVLRASLADKYGRLA